MELSKFLVSKINSCSNRWHNRFEDQEIKAWKRISWDLGGYKKT